MKLFQSLLILVVFTLFNQKTIAQTYRFKTNTLSILEKDKKGKWGNWTDFKKANLIIELDGKKDRFIINSEQIQLFFNTILWQSY